MTDGVRVGYVRVSSFDQNEARQLEQMKDVVKVYTDKGSSQRMFKILR